MPDSSLRTDFLPPAVRDRLTSLGTVTWNGSTENYTTAQLREQIDGVDVLVTGWGSPELTEDVLSEADELQLLAHTGGSVADIASRAVYDAGIPVVSANDVMADYTAEHTIAALLAQRRAIPGLDASMHLGEWDRTEHEIHTLHDATIGLVGLGTIGRKLLAHLAPFEPTVRIYDPYVDEPALEEYPFASFADLDTALDAEVVAIHAARTPETRGMLDAERLSVIPDGSLLVNTARAEIVDEGPLLAELRSGRLSAVLDVYHEEPLPEEHDLRDLDNVLLTPHVGGSQIRPPLGAAVVDDIERFAVGDSLEHRIPREQWATMTR
jgi:phosphoglycerate dehydrogenase-like enzyme